MDDLTRAEIKMILESLYARELDYTGAPAHTSREWVMASQKLREKMHTWLGPEQWEMGPKPQEGRFMPDELTKRLMTGLREMSEER